MKLRVVADSYPKGYDIMLPEYSGGTSIEDLLAMIGHYHSGQGSSTYQFQCREGGADDGKCLEEVRGVRDVLEDVLEGKYEDAPDEDIVIAQAWLPTLQQLVEENAYRDDEDENSVDA